jgi:hypothetical protein
MVPIDGSARKEHPIRAAKYGALFPEVIERVRRDEPVTGIRQDGTKAGRVLVAVELSGPSFRSEYRQLGSLTERHGMRMYLEQPLSAFSDRARASVAVPRADTPREAEEVVAAFLDWIRSHGKTNRLLLRAHHLAEP